MAFVSWTYWTGRSEQQLMVNNNMNNMNKATMQRVLDIKCKKYTPKLLENINIKFTYDIIVYIYNESAKTSYWHSALCRVKGVNCFQAGSKKFTKFRPYIINKKDNYTWVWTIYILISKESVGRLYTWSIYNVFRHMRCYSVEDMNPHLPGS